MGEYVANIGAAQERPCARCIKRNIGHLCHDERRETDSATKKAKSQHSNSVEDEATPPEQTQTSTESGMTNPFDQRPDQVLDASLGLGGAAIHTTPLQIVQPSPVSGIQQNALNSNNSHCMYVAGFSGQSLTTHSYRVCERLDRFSESIPGHAQLSSFIHVQCP